MLGEGHRLATSIPATRISRPRNVSWESLRKRRLAHALILGALCLANSAFSALGSERPSKIAFRIEALSKEPYYGGMSAAVVEIAADVRQQISHRRGAALPECDPLNPWQGLVVVTGVGSTQPQDAPPTDPELSELKALLDRDQPFVRDAAAFIIGEIGPAASALAPDLSGDDLDRPIWFGHALGRITCERFSLSQSLDLVPAPMRSSLIGHARAPSSLEDQVHLIARLLKMPNLYWPDEYFSSAVAPDAGRDPDESQRIKPEWIQTIADRLIDASTPMRLQLDLASLMNRFGRAALPAAETMWDLAQRSEEDLAYRLALAVIKSGDDRAIDAVALLLTRLDASVDVVPDQLCEQTRAAELIAPLLRERLSGDNWRETTYAVEKLACIDPIGSAGALRGALDHPSWDVQKTAVGALAKSERVDARTTEALRRIGREHWSGLVRREAEKVLIRGAPEAESDELMLSFPCFHRCLTDHLRRCGDEDGIVDGIYISPSMGELDIEWERARRIPRPDGFPIDVPEDSRPGYGTSTYLRVEDGWLYATDLWHYDGEIAFVDDNGKKSPVADWGEDAVAIIETPHFGRVMLGRALFTAGDVGILAPLRRTAEGWRMTPRVGLPSPPWGWAFASDGTLLVADPYEAVAVMKDGRIEALDCPTRAPTDPPRSLLALARSAPRHPSARNQRLLADDLAVRESLFVEQLKRIEQIKRNPASAEVWERPDLLEGWLQQAVDDLFQSYLAAGRAESGIERISQLPDELVEIRPSRLFHLRAAAGHTHLAKTQLERTSTPDDPRVQRIHAAIALGEGRAGDARTALAHIRPSEADVGPDPYVDLLRQLASRGRAGSNVVPEIEAKWPAPIHAYLSGSIDEKALVLASHRRDGRPDREKLCEALFYNGLKLSLDGKPGLARRHFQAVVDLDVEHFFEHAVAAVLLDPARERPH
jgi:hypothetical protein